LRIAIDVRTVTPVRSGVGNYVLHLLEGLRKVAPEEELFLVAQPVNLSVIKRRLANRLVYRTNISHESHPLGDLWEHMWLPRILHNHRVQIMHGPATLVPLSKGKYSTVVTIHDLVAFLFPHTIPRKYALYMRWLIRRVVQRADRIISVSHNTKNDLVQILEVDPARISVIHEAAQPAFTPIEDEEKLKAVRQRYGIEGPFFYHVGNIEPRKNLARLVKAFMILRSRVGPQINLVITGQKGWLTGKLFRAMEGVDKVEGVIFTGYVPHEDLPLLMNAADVFVFPSLYEGFGLPTLEAMSCGTPVITSNISSLPEIVGKAAVLVDPYSEEDIALGMQKVLEDTAFRQHLAESGLFQSAKFSWEKAAAQTMGVYRQVFKERN
jgi:glycosyltransferase involved in cell wall biosynthesis